MFRTILRNFRSVSSFLLSSIGTCTWYVYKDSLWYTFLAMCHGILCTLTCKHAINRSSTYLLKLTRDFWYFEIFWDFIFEEFIYLQISYLTTINSVFVPKPIFKCFPNVLLMSVQAKHNILGHYKFSIMLKGENRTLSNSVPT